MGRLGLLLPFLLPALVSAQEGKQEQKPDLELPEVVITGIDESLLGVGETPDLPTAESEALPLAIPPLGTPAEITLTDRATRTEFETIEAPEIPPELSVRGFFRAARYRTVTAGFDASKQVGGGGIFSQLWGRASDGHIRGGQWGRIGAEAGVVTKPSGSTGFRLALSHRAREQDLPVDGNPPGDWSVSPAINPPDQTQRLRTSGADLRYRFDGQDGFVAGVLLRAETAEFRVGEGVPKQGFFDGGGDVHLEMPLDGRLWILEMDLGLGGLREESPEGETRKRQRITGALVGRLTVGGGWCYHAGILYRRLGDRDVIGPRLRVIHLEPPTRRVWVGIEPYFAEPDIIAFLDRVPFASGEVWQEPERAPVRAEAGVEVRPVSALSFHASTDLRRSRAFLRTARHPEGRGLYRLVADANHRWVSETALGLDWGLPLRFRLHADYHLTWVEGKHVSYVAPHRGALGIRYAGPVELGLELGYVSRRWGDPGQGERRLPETWLLSGDLSLELVQRWSLTVEGENLLDRRHWEYWEYIGLPRSIEAGIRYAF